MYYVYCEKRRGSRCLFPPNSILKQDDCKGEGGRRDLVVRVDVRRCNGWIVDGALCLFDVGRCLAVTTAD